MKDYSKLMQKVSLFSGIETDELSEMLSCLNSVQKNYSKNEIIARTGDPVSSVGIILKGRIQVLKEDPLGNRNIMTELSEGNMFAETFACAHIKTLPVTIVSVTQTEVLYIDYRRIISSCSNSCNFHIKLIENMLSILAAKNLFLNEKIEVLSIRTTRDKLLHYLFSVSKKNNSAYFDIPFNRQELADYLCVDRSALSRELGRLRDEKLIDFHKNSIKIL